tara:strand:- start:197 stop:628 length:432 start_codon:yes stop_codon:yes gene_type:complete
MIKKFIDTLLGKKNTEEKLECSIDDEIVDCSELEAPVGECGPGHFTQGYGFFGYTGIPAPAYLQDDEWFGAAPISYVNEDVVEQDAEIKRQEEEQRQEWTVESSNIHQLMYEMATKSSATTLQLDPIGGSENFQGGSENFHES